MKHLGFLNKVLNISAERYLKSAGDLFIYDGDYESALEMVEKTLEIEPDDIRALVLKGDILYCLNRDLEALQVFNHVLSINADCVEALISKAGVLDVLGRHRDALVCCNRAFELIRAHQAFLLPSLYDQKMLLLLRLKRYREALRLLDEAVGKLGGEDYQYLNHSYRPILERCFRGRDIIRKRAGTLSLKVLAGGANA